MAKPLTELTKKNSFKWGLETQKAIEALKQAITTSPVLALPDFSKSFVLECDALETVLGPMQDGRPLAYYGKALSPTHLSQSIYEKDLMAVVLPIRY